MKHRIERVCEILKREVGIIICRELDFGSALVTVSAVDITPDLKQAHVFVSALGSPGQQRRALEALERNRVMIQSEVARRVTLKYTPHLYFKIDAAIERGTRVLSIMDELGLEEDAP